MRRRAIAALALAFTGAAAIFSCSDDDSNTSPARADAATMDQATVDREAPADAADEAPTGPFCQLVDASSSLVFCGDFESVAPPLFGFEESSADPDAGSSISISDDGGKDHPSRVLEVSLAYTSALGDAAAPAFLVRNLPPGKAPSSYLRYEVDFDFHVVGTGTPSLAYVVLGILAFPQGAIKEHGIAVYDGNVFGRLVPKDLGVKDDKSLWHHAHIVVARAATDTSFATTIDVDDTRVDNVGGVNPGTSAAGTSAVRIGAFETSPDAAGSIHAQFDNVVIRRW